MGAGQRGRVTKGDILMGQGHFRVWEKSVDRETPKINKHDPSQIRPLAIVERVSELTISCNQIGD